MPSLPLTNQIIASVIGISFYYLIARAEQNKINKLVYVVGNTGEHTLILLSGRCVMSND